MTGLNGSSAKGVNEFSMAQSVNAYDGFASVTMTVDNCTEQMRIILVEILPEVMRTFAAKNADYGDMAYDLGPAAQFVDLHRKVMKLKRALWDGVEMTFEGVDEILGDMVGHALLALLMSRPEAQEVLELPSELA